MDGMRFTLGCETAAGHVILDGKEMTVDVLPNRNIWQARAWVGVANLLERLRGMGASEPDLERAKATLLAELDEDMI